LTGQKAILLDRDGILDELVYYPDQGLVDTPFTVRQFQLIEGVGPALRGLHEAGYKLVVVSNQPGIAKKHFTMETFKRMQKKMHRMLAAEGVKLDAEYYCFHHPQARLARYRVYCDCRKPKPGLILRAANEVGLDLANSFMIGDGLYDVMAGKSAATKTILVSNLNSLIIRRMDELDAEPDFVARNVVEASGIVKSMTTEIVQQ
jgi:D-glycero-D-manno-heptose 1,7-bisphosphate phosphatase